MCTEQKVTVGEPERDGRLGRPRTMSKTIPQVPLLVESTLNVRTIRVRLKGILVEQDSEVRVAGVRHELIGDARNMITGFQKNNRMNFPQAAETMLVGFLRAGPGFY